MHCIFTIVRYPKYLGLAGLLSMLLFRFPLLLNNKISFWKLLGCGKNGAFDIHPDWRQWAVLVVSRELLIAKKNNEDQIQTSNLKLIYGSFIIGWWKFFNCEMYTVLLEPIEGHGSWDGKKVFGELPKPTDCNGIIAILTRATIRLSKLKNFWKNVDSVALKVSTAPGLIASVGVGELPWIKQATFSIWQNKEYMQQFAYNMQEHTDVIHKTRQENWYGEEMFVRFKPIASFGSIRGSNPLAGKL